jgi:hypothetical protein
MSSRSSFIVPTLSDRGPSFQYAGSSVFHLAHLNALGTRLYLLSRKSISSVPVLKLAHRSTRSVAAATFTFYLGNPISSIPDSKYLRVLRDELQIVSASRRCNGCEATTRISNQSPRPAHGEQAVRS